jgi:hypothetical protein
MGGGGAGGSVLFLGRHRWRTGAAGSTIGTARLGSAPAVTGPSPLQQVMVKGCVQGRRLPLLVVGAASLLAAAAAVGSGL